MHVESRGAWGGGGTAIVPHIKYNLTNFEFHSKSLLGYRSGGGVVCACFVNVMPHQHFSGSARVLQCSQRLPMLDRLAIFFSNIFRCPASLVRRTLKAFSVFFTQRSTASWKELT